jgi:MFS family permease
LWQFVANVAYVACAVTLVEIVTARTRAFATSISISLSVGIGLGFGPTLVAALNESIGRGDNALVLSLLIVLLAMAALTAAGSTLLISRLELDKVSTTEKNLTEAQTVRNSRDE